MVRTTVLKKKKKEAATQWKVRYQGTYTELALWNYSTINTVILKVAVFNVVQLKIKKA